MSSLYDDKQVTITDTDVILKFYYFPCFSKTIAFKDIERIYTDHEYGLTTLGYHAWGMGLSNIWWAWAGLFVRPKNNFIIKIKDTNPCCGFSVERPEEFLEILESKGVQGPMDKEK